MVRPYDKLKFMVSREGCILHCILLYSNWLYPREGVKDVSGKLITGEDETASFTSSSGTLHLSLYASQVALYVSQVAL